MSNAAANEAKDQDHAPADECEPAEPRSVRVHKDRNADAAAPSSSRELPDTIPAPAWFEVDE